MTKKTHTHRHLLRLIGVGMFFMFTAVPRLQAQSDDPASIPPPQTVTIAGTVQPQLGCSGEWNTTCEESQLLYDPADDLWLATFELAAGEYEYKAALNGSWDDNYGLNAEYYGPNIPLAVAEDGPVTFWYDHKTRWVSDSVNSLLANVSGSFQDEIGCPGEWQPDCLRSLLQDPNGDGSYTFITALIPAGEYEAKVAVGQSWDENYGADGAADGANIPFAVGEGQAVIFTFDPTSKLLTIETTDDIPQGLVTDSDQAGGSGGGLPPAAAPFPDLVVVPGTIQSVLGCPGDWLPDCEATALTFDQEDQVWTAVFDIPPGDYEYKVALNGSWDVNFGLNAERDGANLPLSLAEDTAVTYFFDHNTGWVADSVNNLIANVPGDFQSEMGCPDDWQPDCLRSWLQEPDGDGTYTFQTVSIPAGSYEAKVAVGQSWDENYGEGGAADGANIPFAVPADGTLVTFVWNSNSKLLSIGVGEDAGPQGNLAEQQAHWVAENLILWDVELVPGNQYFFHYDPAGNLFSLGPTGISGGTAVPLTVYPGSLPADIAAKYPHLRDLTPLQFDADDLGFVRIALKGQTAVSAQNAEGQIIDATGLQIPGVLDDLYTYDGELGVIWDGDVPALNLWAPTARLVKLHLFDNSSPTTQAEVLPLRIDPQTGVWSIIGEPDWKGKYYLYEVQVYVSAENSVQTNLVTDPYSFSLAQNSSRSQIVDLNDPALRPDGWNTVEKPPLAAPEDIVIYELHIRDFSVNDPSVPDELKGTYLAFTQPETFGMTHLRRLADSGLTHLHLLPAFDIATINEDKTTWQSPSFSELAGFSPDSEEQQALVEAAAETDGFNWGYDPLHYTVPEGSYATNPDGAQRILEFRQMVQVLNTIGLRVVMDVVYNHTNAAGQSDLAVLDRIVPGYYHRLNAAGKVERSTCCANTASEHAMMQKLMVDSVLTWAEAYKVDGFRFDLMGHHMKEDMLAVRAALDGLTVADNGVDGTAVYVYGEGWNFGEVADNARGINATQLNMGGTGIGTFNDRIRDAIRGGNPFGDYQKQGFINGLYYDPNASDQGDEAAQLAHLLELTDHIRVGLAGNLADFSFIGANGEMTTGSTVLYNGQIAGYTQDPQETINYASAHDNETLFDAIQYKAPGATTAVDRAHMQQMGLSLVMLGQGVPFFHAGSDLLRSKDFDRDSYNSGDWFNRLDFTYETNNWGTGLPVASKNQENWPLQQPLLADPTLAPGGELVRQTAVHFQMMLQVRRSSPLFRLQTADEVMARLHFHNTGPDQIPGLIVMSLSDQVGADLDPAFDQIVVLFNANDEAQTFTINDLAGVEMVLHPILAASSDGRYAEMAFTADSGTFTVPGRSTAVFVLPEGAEETAAVVEEESEEEVVEEATAGAETVVADTVVAETAVTTEPSATPPPPSESETGFPTWLAIGGLGVIVVIILAVYGRRRNQRSST